MGINVNVKVFNADELRTKLRELGANNDDLMNRILAKCGLFEGESYIIFNNEYYDESPYYAAITLLDSAFGIESQCGAFHKCSEREVPNYIEDAESAEELGIVIKDDE